MNTSQNRFKIIITGMAALVIGVGIGVAGTELRTGNPGSSQPAQAATNRMSLEPSSGSNSASPENEDPFQEIRNMQAQMDRSFDRMFEQFRAQPPFNVFTENPGYSLSLDVRDLKDRYEVRAFLPDAKASDVHVSLKDGQTLKVEVNRTQTSASHQQNAVSQVAEWGQYQQMIQFPTPVKAGEMKVKRNDHELIITVPKAT